MGLSSSDPFLFSCGIDLIKTHVPPGRLFCPSRKLIQAGLVHAKGGMWLSNTAYR